jgi:hypothetical protein
MSKKFLDGFYLPRTLDEYLEDYDKILSDYYEKSHGFEKTNILIDFLILKEKDHIDYFLQKVRY